MSEEIDPILQKVIQFSEAFDNLTQARHEMGAQEYGVMTFIGNDVIRMMAEELADTSNYCRMQFIKLMILQELLEESLEATTEDNIQMGAQAFKGVGEVGWN